jgi:tight adherence protein C
VIGRSLMAVAVMGGGAVGAGVFLAVREITSTTPALGPALRRLHPPPRRVDAHPAGRAALLRRMSITLRLPDQDLALVDRSRERHVLTLLANAVIGLALPPLLSVTLWLTGVQLPVVVPVLASASCAALFGYLAHRDMLAKADRARAEFVRAVCIYLDLVALQLSAAHGPVQALERAASICHGPAFVRIRDALTTAQLQLGAPWEELRALAARIGVPELGELGAILQTAGADGAQVQRTLLAQANSLRDQVRTDALARAEAITARLDIPGAALVFVLVLFVLYPFVTRV